MEGIWKAIGAVALAAAAVASAFIPGGQVFTPMLISSAVALGSSWLADQIAGEEAAQERARTPTGISTEVTVGGAVPRQVAIGAVGIAGHLIYANTYGDDDDADAENTEKVHNK